MVVNASNRQKIVDWMQHHLSARSGIDFADATLETAMIAVQGPRAIALVAPRVDCDLAAIGYYHAVETKIDGVEAIVSRTGYTGEDGCEFIVPAAAAKNIWEDILQAGRDQGAMACGLGARDTLRLEAAMPLYGHELNEEITPLEAGLGFAVDLEGRAFPGSSILAAIKRDGPKRIRVGLELAGKRVPRRTLRDFFNRPANRRNHQRHVFAHAAKTHRDGLCSSAIRPAKHRIIHRYPRRKRDRLCRQTTVLQATKSSAT